MWVQIFTANIRLRGLVFIINFSCGGGDVGRSLVASAIVERYE